MKTLGNIFIGIALICALGGVVNTFWAENLLTPSVEALQEKTLLQMRSSTADGRNAAKYIEARTQSESLSSGQAGNPNKIAEEVIAKGQEDQEADLQSQEEKYTQTRNKRRTKMTWYFILAGLFGTTGAICRASGKRKEDGAVSGLDSKRCPFCDEPIRQAAKFCRFCNREVNSADANTSKSNILEAPSNNNTSREYLISRNNDTSGPFTATQMREMIRERQIFPMDLVWYGGLEEWTQLYKITEFTESSPSVITAPTPTLNNNKPIQASDKSNALSEDIELFAGKNGDYYKRAWSKYKVVEESKSKARSFRLSGRKYWVGWNWAAFLFGGFWLAYRKMYLNSFLFLGACGIPFLRFFLGDSPKQPSIYLLYFVFPFVANARYLQHAEKRILKIKKKHPNRFEQEIEIARKGGTSLAAGIVLPTVFCILFGILIQQIEEKTSSGEKNQAVSVEDKAKTEAATPLLPDVPVVPKETSNEGNTEEREEIERLNGLGFKNIEMLQTIPARFIGPLIAAAAGVEGEEVKEYAKDSRVGTLNETSIELNGKTYPLFGIRSGVKNGDFMVLMGSEQIQFVILESDSIKKDGFRFAIVATPEKTRKATTIAIK